MTDDQKEIEKWKSTKLESKHFDNVLEKSLNDFKDYLKNISTNEYEKIKEENEIIIDYL